MMAENRELRQTFLYNELSLEIPFRLLKNLKHFSLSKHLKIF